MFLSSPDVTINMPDNCSPSELLAEMDIHDKCKKRITGALCNVVCTMFSLELVDNIDIMPISFGDKVKESEHSIAAKKMLIVYSDLKHRGLTYASTLHGDAALILFARYCS